MTYGVHGRADYGRRPRRTGLIASVVVVVLVAAIVGGVLLWRRHDAAAEADRAQSAARAVATAWTAGAWGTLAFDGTSAAAVTTAYDATVAGLDGAKPIVTLTKATRSDQTLKADLKVSWTLPGGASWTYPTSARLVERDGRWLLTWTSALVHPRLGQGDRLLVARTTAERAPILGRDGEPLVRERPVVRVGIHPARATDLTALSKRLGELLGVDPASLEKRARAAKPDNFVPVITLRREDYDPLRDRLRALDGTVFREDTVSLAPTRDFARALLGTVGPVTKEMITKSHGRLTVGDEAGLSGLSAQYDERLAGTAGVTVFAQPAGASGTAQGRTPLWSQPAKPGQPVQVTLEERVQQAADAALKGMSSPSALVAVDVASGDVLAVANGPQPGGYDQAILGHYAPGSAFKIVTTLALLGKGLDVDEPVACPQLAHVQGKSFHNYEHEQLGTVPFHVDFADSCNTAFIGLADRLDADDLTTAAARLGIGTTWTLGTSAFSGSVPATTGPVDHAAASFGQGKVVASPLALAVMAASVAHGSTVTPRLVVQPEPKPASPAEALPAGAATTLQSLMREVVTSGTGRVLADVPGGPVHAKTGTAEFGDDDPPKTHTWLVGYQGDIAFAAFVEDGVSGASTSAPIVRRFLTALAH